MLALCLEMCAAPGIDMATMPKIRLRIVRRRRLARRRSVSPRSLWRRSSPCRRSSALSPCVSATDISHLNEQDVYQQNAIERGPENRRNRTKYRFECLSQLHFPSHRIADRDGASLDHLRKCSTAPAFAHGRLETLGRLFHQLARPRLAANQQAGVAN